MNRGVIALLCGIAVVLALAIAMFFGVPYKTTTKSINRRTGEITSVIAYFRIPLRHEQKPSLIEPLGVPLTAPDINLEWEVLSYRFPWSSEASTDLGGEGSYTQRDYEYLFETPRKYWREIPSDQFDAIMRKRLTIWNSELRLWQTTKKELKQEISEENIRFLKSQYAP